MLKGSRFFNPEKAADTPALFVIHRGIRLNSRYGFTREYQRMMSAIDALPEDSRDRISTIFCDSKATNTYEVGGHPTIRDLEFLEEGFMACAGGHNGIFAGDLWLDPNWDE